MKVFWISHTGKLGGAERCLAEASLGLVAAGHEVRVVLPFVGELKSHLEGCGVTVFTIPYLWWVHDANTKLNWLTALWRVVNHVRAAYRMRRLIGSFEPDVVITNTITVPSGALAAKLGNTPHVWYVHEFGDKDHNLVFDHGKRASFWLINKLSDRVIVNSRPVCRYVQQHLPESNPAVVYYAVDVAPPVQHATLPNGFNLVLVGRIGSGKGQHEAIEALSVLQRGGLADLHLTLVGAEFDPAYSTHIRGLIEKHNLPQHVHIEGFSQSPLSYLREADVVLVCSSNEAFGRVTVEAMKLSRAVIGARAGGTEDLIQDGITGVLYEPGNIDDLAERIKQLYADAALRLQIGSNAYKWSTATFNRENSTTDLLKVIKRVTSNRCNK